MLSDYVGGVDYPVSHFYKEILEIYPEAKVLLNRRSERDRGAGTGGVAKSGQHPFSCLSDAIPREICNRSGNTFLLRVRR